ncbi:hypothetical protein NN561_005857 [Cricetulus griseus]
MQDASALEVHSEGGCPEARAVTRRGQEAAGPRGHSQAAGEPGQPAVQPAGALGPAHPEARSASSRAPPTRGRGPSERVGGAACAAVGTLDVLVGLSDELAKLDAFVEGVVKKVAQYMADVLEDSKDKVQENLLASGGEPTLYDLGSLLTRSLAEIVKKDDFVLDSEYLVTLLVVVPKLNHNDWIKQYETLSEMVVPRSSKFIVRDFQYNEEEMKADKEEMNRLSTDKKKQFGPLVRWLKVNFSEAFIAWIHIKALRVFVESVLRYGLPVNFQAMLLQPNKKSVKKLREVLHELYKHLDSSAAAIIDVQHREDKRMDDASEPKEMRSRSSCLCQALWSQRRKTQIQHPGPVLKDRPGTVASAVPSTLVALVWASRLGLVCSRKRPFEAFAWPSESFSFFQALCSLRGAVALGTPKESLSRVTRDPRWEEMRGLVHMVAPGRCSGDTQCKACPRVTPCPSLGFVKMQPEAGSQEAIGGFTQLPGESPHCRNHVQPPVTGLWCVTIMSLRR